MEEEFKKKVKLLKRDLKYHGSILDVYQDTVDVNGHEVHWDMIKHHGASAVVPITDDGKIILVKQFRLSIDRYTLEIPAGKLEEGEDPMVGAKRELREETGYEAGEIYHLCDMGTAYAYCDEVVHIYVAKNLKKGEVDFDTDEETIVKIYDVETLKQMIFNSEIKDSKTILGIMSYLVKEKKA